MNTTPTHSASNPPLHQGIDAPLDASSYMADSETDLPSDGAISLVNLIAKQVLKREDVMNAIGKMSDRGFALVRKNLEMLGDLDRAIRVAEKVSAGKMCGLR